MTFVEDCVWWFLACFQKYADDLPRVRIELTTLRLWDSRAAYCALEAQRTHIIWVDIKWPFCHFLSSSFSCRSMFLSLTERLDLQPVEHNRNYELTHTGSSNCVAEKLFTSFKLRHTPVRLSGSYDFHKDFISFANLAENCIFSCEANSWWFGFCFPEGDFSLFFTFENVFQWKIAPARVCTGRSFCWHAEQI